MPGYKRKRDYKSRGRKKTFKRSQERVRNVAPGRMTRLSPSNGVYGFPQELVTRLRYNDVVRISTTGLALGSYSFRMNSLFDPDFTGTGHQPYYFDQLAALYTRYVVVSSKITVEYMPITDYIATAVPVGPIVVGLRTDDNGSVSSTLSTAQEEQLSTTTLIGSPTGGNNKITMVKTYSPSRDLGLTIDDDTVGAPTNGNPSQVWFANLFSASIGDAASTTMLCKVQMEFVVKFTKTLEVSGS